MLDNAREVVCLGGWVGGWVGGWWVGGHDDAGTCVLMCVLCAAGCCCVEAVCLCVLLFGDVLVSNTLAPH
jgi:hypothetical protein